MLPVQSCSLLTFSCQHYQRPRSAHPCSQNSFASKTAETADLQRPRYSA